MMRHRKNEVKFAFVHGDPTIVEMAIALSGLLFGVFINYPFAPGNLSSIFHQLILIAPAWIWSLIFVLASFLLTISPSVKPFHNIGVLTTFFLWVFLFCVSILNIAVNKSSTLAPPAYLCIILLCAWVYLRRTGGLGESVLYYRLRHHSPTLAYSSGSIDGAAFRETATKSSRTQSKKR